MQTEKIAQMGFDICWPLLFDFFLPFSFYWCQLYPVCFVDQCGEKCTGMRVAGNARRKVIKN